MITEIKWSLFYLAVICLILTTGCASVSESEYQGHRVVMHPDPVSITKAHRASQMGGYRKIAGFVDFEKKEQGWCCVIHLNAFELPKAQACALQHEMDWHCTVGMEYVADNPDATRWQILRAASTHPRFDADGNRYKDCGRS